MSEPAKKLRRTILLGLGCLAPLLAPPGTGPLEAQDPEDPLDHPEPLAEDTPLGWQGSADLGASFTSGNSDITSLSTGIEVSYRRERDRWTGRGAILRTTTEGEETANRMASHLQYDFFPAARAYIFGRGVGMANRPAGIRARLIVGAGGGYDVLRRDGVELAVEGGATHLAEELMDRTTDSHFNVLAGQRLDLEVAEDTRIRQTLEVQPRIDDFGDYLAEGEVVLSTEILGGLGLRVSLAADYEARPFDPPDEEPRERLDTTFVTGVTYSF